MLAEVLWFIEFWDKTEPIATWFYADIGVRIIEFNLVSYNYNCNISSATLLLSRSKFY